MPSAPSVVINSAGSGRRMGGERCKALIEVAGRRLIDRQLDLVRDVSDLRVVVGFQAAEVIEAVRVRRPDAIFVFNHNYASTATAYSLLLAVEHVEGDVISLDGDLVIDGPEFDKLLQRVGPVVGVSPLASEEPVYADVNDGRVQAFSRVDRFDHEWTGLLRLPAALLREAGRRLPPSGHVFQLLEPLLALPATTIIARDVDTPADLIAAESALRHRLPGA